MIKAKSNLSIEATDECWLNNGGVGPKHDIPVNERIRFPVQWSPPTDYVAGVISGE